MNQLIGYLSEGEQLKGSLTIPQQLGGSTLGTKTITANDTYYAEDDGYDGYSEVTVNVSGGGGGTLETITKTYTPSTSQQTEQITPSSGYDGIAEVDVTVNAMPTGTLGKPLAMKGTVSNHQVDVTPVVATQAGYIATQSKSGDPVTVSASELDSGTKSITANGNNQDVVGYAAVDVAVPNSYSAGDEGKVVDNGALVAQTAHADVTPTTSDQTIDTTLNNSLKVIGDADLVAGNIKKDVEIFGVTGSYEGGGGGSGTGGTFTPAERTGTYTFYAPNCTYLACGLTETADLTTGKGFVYSFFCYAGHYYSCRSTNSGTSSAGDANINANPQVSYANDTFTLYWGTLNDNSKIPQVGKTYTWYAW